MSLILCICVHEEGGGCIFGSDSEVPPVKHSSKPGPLPSSEGLCVPTTAAWMTLARPSVFNEVGKDARTLSPVSFLGKPARHKREKESVLPGNLK